MATGRNNTYGAPSMGRQNNTSNNGSSSRSNNNYGTTAYGRSNSNDPETMTLELVGDFKHFVQRKTRGSEQMSQSDVESQVADIRCNAYPDQCDLDQWKRRLPRDVKDCPQTILRLSMAYGNNPDEVQSIIRTKMDGTDGSSTETSLDNVIGPLSKLKKELDKKKPRNLFREVRNFDDDHIDRANRLFLSEAYHVARGLKGYIYAEAANAVQAIRETDCENADPTTILVIIKTLQDVNSIRDYLNSQSQKKSTQHEHQSSDDDDDRHASSNPIKNTARTHHVNDTPTFHYKPMVDPYASKPTASTSRRFEHRPQDESSRSPPRHRPPRE